jgi:hypothetical protein
MEADSAGLVDELSAAGLWQQLDETECQIDWAEQDSADNVKARQERNADRQRKYRRRRELHNNDDHSECHPQHCNALRNGSVTQLVTVSRPVPSPSGDRERGSAARR